MLKQHKCKMSTIGRENSRHIRKGLEYLNDVDKVQTKCTWIVLRAAYYYV